MYGRTLHAKTSTIDGVFSSVGSYKLDHWSARRNLEVTVSMYGPRIAFQLKDKFLEDLKISKEVTLQGWRDRSCLARFVQWGAYQLMRL
jgi:cardiolipin synthase